jgi:heptosyltransferase II
MTAPRRLIIVAPNWLGDAVMALPLIADIRREWADTHLTVAARASVAPLFHMVDAVDDVVVLEGGGGWGAIRSVTANATALGQGEFDAALLLPNSFLSAWTLWRAGIKERWGFRRDARGRLLTRAIARPPRDVHQAEYYKALGTGLGLGPASSDAASAAPSAPEARVGVSDQQRASAKALLESLGIPRDTPFVAMAPGAAYGRAKQWLPERFAELARLLRAERDIGAVVVGSRADAPVCREIAAGAPGVVDLSGRTDLPTLAGVLAVAHGVVANDSGAMHLAAAVGARVVAVFGATNEKKTAPLSAGPGAPAATVVATDVWCRPCMLRECPIDHRCMTRIGARAVLEHL